MDDVRLPQTPSELHCVVRREIKLFKRQFRKRHSSVDLKVTLESLTEASVVTFAWTSPVADLCLCRRDRSCTHGAYILRKTVLTVRCSAFSMKAFSVGMDGEWLFVKRLSTKRFVSLTSSHFVCCWTTEVRQPPVNGTRSLSVFCFAVFRFFNCNNSSLLSRVVNTRNMQSACPTTQ